MTISTTAEPASPERSTFDPAALTRRIADLLRRGQPAAARPMLSALRRLAPGSTRTIELEARMLVAEGRAVEALAVLDGGIADSSPSGELLLCRAEVHMAAGRFALAAHDAAGAILLDPAGANAKAVLGIILIETGQYEDAIACLAEAVDAEPGSVAYRRGLGEALERHGDVAAARATMEEGIRLTPNAVSLRTAAIMTAMRQRDFAGAIELAEAARDAGIADASVFGLLGHALSNMGRHDHAGEAYAEAAKLAPDDPYVRHLVRSAGNLPSASRAPADYVEVLFDGYAERFEHHLISLGYRVPGLIRAALLEAIAVPLIDRADAQPVGPVLDLGCGTGLLGVVTSDLKLAPLVGVDLSGEMLQRAAKKGVYHELLRSDLESLLGDVTRSWRIILAADVFCYFGALEPTFAAAHDRLEPDGLFILTVELLEDGDDAAEAGGWRLRSQGRYAHARGYVERAATRSGLQILLCREETLRLEAEAPVPGLLVVLRRGATDA